MKKIQKKHTPKLLGIFAVLVITLLITLSACTTEISPHDGISFNIKKDGNIIYKTDEGLSSPPDFNGSISLHNTSKEELSFTVFTSNEGSQDIQKNTSVTLKSGAAEELTLTNESNLRLEYIEVKKQGSDAPVSYLFTSHALESLSGNQSAEPVNVVLAVNTSLEKYTVTGSLSIILSGTTLDCESILLTSESDGKFTVKEENGGKLKTESFFADAPKFMLKLPKLKFIEESPDFYLRVFSYNNKELDTSTRTVTSLKNLQLLLNEDSLPTLYSGTHIVLSGDYTVTDELNFSIPVSISFLGNVTVENPVSITTNESSSLSFFAESKVTLPNIPLNINAPEADITYDIPRVSGITMHDIASKMNVKTVNGTAPEAYELGGDSTAELTSLKLLKSKNKNITENITWRKNGFTLHATVDCVVDSNTLKNAILDSAVSNGGKVEFDNVNSDGSLNLLSSTGIYCTVTDKSGRSSRYLIETEYIPTLLPVVVINTDSGEQVESNEEYQKGTFYMNTEGTDFSPLSLSEIDIRGRGHSTWKWEKKPYKIKFSSKKSLLGLEANKEWTLLANYSDKSLIRNYVAFEGIRAFGDWNFIPTQHPVDVFFNGEYVGVYTLGEQLEAKSGRVELGDRGNSVNTGYLLEIGGTSSADVWNETCYYTTLCKYVKVKFPNDKELTKDQVAYIRDWTKKADEAVMNGEGYEEYIDVPKLIDWVIAQELIYNIDCCFRRSCYFIKQPDGKLEMGPLWDFDNAFGNFWKDDKTYSTFATADSTSGYIWDNWMSYLIADPDFREQLRARWDEVKYDFLDALINAVREGERLVERSAKYNFEVWDILNKRVGCEDTSITKYNTYEKQIDYLESFIRTRWQWLDENI